jgi:spermidine/putrescine-binding protein
LTTVTIGHAALNLPVVAVIVRARLRQLDPALVEAARNLGATPWQAFFRVTLPLLAPAIFGAMLLAFTLSLDDFIATFFTAGPGATTLPLKVYSMVKSGLSPEINALSAVIVLISMAFILASLLIQRRGVSLPLLPQGKIVLAIFSLVACTACQPTPGDGPKPTPQSATLHYFTWSDYADQAVLEEFEKREGVKVVVDTFGSNEELLAKLQSGATGYDVAVPSDFMVSILAKQGLLAELDLSQLPNARLLLERLQHLPFDPANRHSIPYLWGTVGIGYDSSRVPAPPESWRVLWDPRHKGRISMLNDQREVFGVALRMMGRSMNARDPGVINEAKRKLLAQKPLVKTYTSESYDQLLASGEVVLAHGWGGAVARAMVDRPSVKYVIPKEGGTIWADCLVLLNSSSRKALALRFMNFLLEPDVAARTTNRLMFATSNREAQARVLPHIRNNPAVYPPDSVFDRLEWMADVGEAIRFYDRGWTELKIH